MMGADDERAGRSDEGDVARPGSVPVGGVRAGGGPSDRVHVTGVPAGERVVDRDEQFDGDEPPRRDGSSIRAEDTEPYVALQYVARLFKIVAMVVVVALTAEVVAGVLLEGGDALMSLSFEVIRGIVLAAILWGAGDLTLLLIDVGHDVRAARVLLGRMSARGGMEIGEREDRRG